MHRYTKLVLAHLRVLLWLDVDVLQQAARVHVVHRVVPVVDQVVLALLRSSGASGAQRQHGEREGGLAGRAGRGASDLKREPHYAVP